MARADGDVFRFEDFEIPGNDPRGFALNDEGVYEVYAEDDAAGAGEAAPLEAYKDAGFVSTGEAKGKKRLSRVPNLKEYFSDLDYLLGVCSDGPAKSFAFRRLKYLASKWSLYCLLNEYQELADMKVRAFTISYESAPLRASEAFGMADEPC
jgi:AMP deaminase